MTTNTETIPVAVRELKVHPGLQPRDTTLLKQREAVRQEAQREQHITDMAALLKADTKAELVPVQVAEVGGVLFVVDGHHRLQAYKRARRETIPARVQTMTMMEASHASKLANVQFTKLEMHPEQKRNALWHHLHHITLSGASGIPEGTSQRKLAGSFGVSLDTVQRMLARLPEVDPSGFPEEHRDSITGVPHWRYVRATARNGMYQAMEPEMRLKWQAGKYADALARLWERFPPEVVNLAHRNLREQAEGAEGEATVRGLDAAWLTSGDTEGDDW